MRAWDSIAKGALRLKERWDDGEFDDNPIVNAATTIGRTATSGLSHAKDAGRRMANDYDGMDIWELGMHFVDRLVRLIDESVRTRSYLMLADPVSEEELREMSDSFKAYVNVLSGDGYCFIWTLDAFSKNEDGKALLNDATEAIQARFMGQWERFGRLFLVGDMREGRTARTPVLRLIGRLRGVPSVLDLDEARRYELRRLVQMMRDYCRDNVGCPYDYGLDGSVVRRLSEFRSDGDAKPQEASDDRIPLSVRFWGNPDVIGQMRESERIDAQYVAYIHDIVKATEVIETWYEWLDGKRHGFEADNPIYASMETLRNTESEALFTGIEDRLRNEFLQTWNWLGRVAMDLWI